MFKHPVVVRRNQRLRRSQSCRPKLEWMEPRTLLSSVTWTGDAGDNKLGYAHELEYKQRAGIVRRRHDQHPHRRGAFRCRCGFINSLTSTEL